MADTPDTSSLSLQRPQPMPTTALPPANGLQAELDPLTQQLMQASQVGQQVFQEQVQRQRNLADTVNQLQQQQQNLPIPKMGYQPQYESPRGKGFLGGLGAVLGDIGKGALQGLGGGTGIGRAVQSGIYGPGVRQYEAQRGALAQQIEELQAQQQREEAPMGAAAQMQYKPLTGAGSVMRGQAALMNAQTENAYKSALIPLKQEAQRIQEELGKGHLTQEQARTQMMGVIASHRDATLQSVAGMYADQRDRDVQVQAVEKEFQDLMDHPFQGLLGLAPTPPSSTPTPAKGPKVPGSATEKPAKSSGVIYARDPQGKLHQAKAGTALPKGWTLESK